MEWKQIISGIIVGAILGIAGTLLLQERRTTRLETQVENLKNQINEQSTNRSQQDLKTLADQDEKDKPEELTAIIQEQQKKNVKESWGEYANQCFTNDDLNRFNKNKTTAGITNSLKSDPKFLDVVLSIRKMETGKRSNLLISAEKTFRPTWAELGRISREGQTEAGQVAEKMIAQAIVNLVRKLLTIPEAEFKSLYR